MKLWQKEYTLDQAVEQFTVGDDYILDKELVFWDCVGSIAHAKMLKKIGILTSHEFDQLHRELISLAHLGSEGKVEITREQEDVHTAIEQQLTKKLDQLGKKIHTGRSRNDQVLVDIRLYSKHMLLQIEEDILGLCETLFALAEQYQEVPVVGYTHMQKAMPSSMGLFFGAVLESMLDNLTLFKAAYVLNNQSPLGSAAGYGVSFPINREFVAENLGFAKVQNNVMYVQNARGKLEANIIFALHQVMHDIGKLSNDLLLFSMPEFGYVSLPEKFCTGSSIMPQKKNPDILELTRAKASLVQGYLVQMTSLMSKLPSGYNRDFQLTKKILIDAFIATKESVFIINHLLKDIKINADMCTKSLTKEVFATDYANDLVKSGMPFREAYQTTATMIEKIKITDPKKNIMSKTHTGAPGNLGLRKIHYAIDEQIKIVQTEKKRFEKCIEKLL